MFLIRQLLEEDSGLLVSCQAIGLQKAVSENYAYVDTRMTLLAAVAELNSTEIKVASGRMTNTYISVAFHRRCFYRPQIEKAYVLIAAPPSQRCEFP